jgi:hypothetical protein
MDTTNSTTGVEAESGMIYSREETTERVAPRANRNSDSSLVLFSKL